MSDSGKPDFEVPVLAEATILVVDDEPANLAVLNELLRPYFRVQVARSGAQALQVLATSPGPDLVLLDVVMPEMDGYEVLTQIRQSPGSHDIPVMFVTAMDSRDNEQHGLELGAVDYITKPIVPGIVLSRVRTHLEAKQARDMLNKTNHQLSDKVTQGRRSLEQAQAQLLQSEKMASIGQMAAGVAHEINNPVGFVGSNLNALETYVQDIMAIVAAYDQACTQAGNPPVFDAARELRQKLHYEDIQQDVAELLAESKDGMARVRKIVQDLKGFSHISDTVWEWSDIHAGLDSTLNMVWNELKYHCTVVKNYGDLPKINCLPTQLNQVFMNLLVNAGHAIEGKGQITIRTECVGNTAVCIKVSDTGVGIAPDALKQVFEPFYTTKPVGKGTGLGLSLVWSIVERHGGKIEVASTLGQGSTFTVTLPVDQGGGIRA
jgi:signal transduction histidine kinase